VETGYNLLALL